VKVRTLLLTTGRYPRTDTFGGTLVGMILMLLAGVLLFTRLVAHRTRSMSGRQCGDASSN
jgi:hypothetical protein